jgi:hypothetical protein
VSEHGPKIEYEKTDADLKAVTKVGIGITVVATVVSLALWPLMKALASRQAKQDAPAAAIPGFDPARKAPEPRLQEAPFGDWLALKARQEALLGSYGWVDENAGVTRIPIDRAMRIVLERGLPSRAPGEAGASAAPAPGRPGTDTAPQPASPAPAPGGHP